MNIQEATDVGCHPGSSRNQLAGRTGDDVAGRGVA